MKKTIFAFLIVAIVAAAAVLLIVKYPKPATPETVSREELLSRGINPIPATPGAVPTDAPKGKMPAGTKPAPSAESLIGTTWVWEKTIMSDGTITSPKKQASFGISFGSDGRLLGKTDCNGFFGTYKIGSDGVITFGPLASTLMYCEGSQESDFTKPFADVTRYESSTDGSLTLLMKDGKGAIVFTKK